MPLVEALALNKCLLGKMKYISKMKSSNARYTINNYNDKKEDRTSIISLILVLTIVEDVSVSISIQKCESFKQLKG